MYAKINSPVKDVDFGEALKLSLDNYYDLLKTNVGALASNEFLQLKLVADPLDLSDKGACLLYTSPSPRDLSTSRMPSSA